MIVCNQCGGTNIETRAWVDPNDNSFISICADGEMDIDDNWCRDCEDHVEFKTKE